MVHKDYSQYGKKINAKYKVNLLEQLSEDSMKNDLTRARQSAFPPRKYKRIHVLSLFRQILQIFPTMIIFWFQT